MSLGFPTPPLFIFLLHVSRTIHTLSTSSQALGQIEDPLSPGLDALEKKQDKLYQDMEMLHENLMLQAAAAEKDDQISALKMEIARLSHK